MSLDMPFYEELRRRGHPAARPWLVGDFLYYIGLLLAFVGVAGSALLILGVLVGWVGWLFVGISAALFPLGLVVFLTGVRLKRHSYILAARDGIDVNDY